MADGGEDQRPRVSDAVHEQVAREMDEAFMWNVTRDSEIRRVLKRLRESDPNPPSVDRERIIKEITAKYRMLVSMARSSRANDWVM
jgi:predicted Fe-S protein YdhL (DUF1289 family)